jgi:hypothetical protein
MGKTHWLVFVETETTGKTQAWSVEHKDDGSFLGMIKWHGAWRQYCFFPSPHCVWSAGCLDDVVAFLGKQMEARRIAPQEARDVTIGKPVTNANSCSNLN